MTAAGKPTRVGWIGVGRMGLEMSRRMLSAGIDLAVWNRTPAKAQPLADAGATIVERPADLADRDVVFTMVAASDDLLTVTVGEDGLLTSAGPRVLVDSSTVSAQASDEVRAAAGARGTALLAAPVSGNPSVARAGKLTFVVSGPREAFEIVEPLLAAIGRGATYVGEGDRARAVKIAHNLILGIMAQALAETTVLAEREGVARADYLAFLNDSVMGSTFSRYKTPALVKLDWTPTFTPPLLRKDLDLGLAAAERVGARLPLVERARERVEALVQEGRFNDDDFQALLVLAARDAGLELEPEPGPVDDGLSS